tara:strand:+ start:118 stop:342 length:225 start_codon:yes stop_codon:yes gene_type:complete
MKHVFLANISFIETPLVESLLKSNKINFFLKKTYEGSVNAGWMTPGGSFQETMLFVDETELKNAQKLLKKYIND